VSEVRQGEIYWLDFGPITGSAPAGRHPCVVVQSDAFNRSRIATTVVCLVTSNMDLGGAPGNVALRKLDANLPKDSVVNISQLLTVDKSDLEELLGKLPAAAVDLITRGLSLLFERV
jgi:mRNA interferase MazF